MTQQTKQYYAVVHRPGPGSGAQYVLGSGQKRWLTTDKALADVRAEIRDGWVVTLPKGVSR